MHQLSSHARTPTSGGGHYCRSRESCTSSCSARKGAGTSAARLVIRTTFSSRSSRPSPPSVFMQRPTCLNTRITTIEDAHRLFHAAGFLGLPEVPMVFRRLDAEERRFVRSGSVFVWEERSTSSEAAGLGIERWTDGLRWGPSRVRDDFLFYQEKFTKAEGNNILTKQTYSAWVDLPNGPKKWHLTAYFTPGSINDLRSIDDIPCMRGLTVPEGMYRRSRTGKRKADTRRLNPVDDHCYSPPSPICEPRSPPHSSFPLYLPFDSQVPPSPTSQSHSSSEPTDLLDEEFYPWKRPRIRAAYNFTPDKQRAPVSSGLAPLSYLQSLQHPRRNPADEIVLRAFASFN